MVDHVINMRYINFLLLLLALFINEVLTEHWIPKQDQMIHNVHIGHHQDVTKKPMTQKIRFKVVYDASIGKLSYPKQSLVKSRLIPSAVEYFHETLYVRDTSEPIKLQPMCQGNAFFLKDEKGVGPGFVQYCKNNCEPTVCGPIKVPKRFLDDCRTCDDTGNKCKITPNRRLKIESVSDKDFILFVSSIQTTHCNEANIVAYASYCQQEHALNRPVAGFANLCPGKLEMGAQAFEGLLSTVKHEIYHALGFSVGLFAFYRDHEGKPYTKRLKNGLPEYNSETNLYQWSNKVVRTIVRNDWAVSGGSIKHPVQVMVTPNVQKEVRRHFGCQDLEGAELENQGGEGTALTHWEKRLFENEAMTGTYTQHPVFSRITLALMEDTGWYRVNYDMAEDLDWGKDLGCLFVKNNCRAWIADRIEQKLHTAPFCATLKQSPLHMRCTHSKLSLALCNLVKYSSKLPRDFQYFDKLGHLPVKDISTYGGAVELADFCPFYQKFTLTEESGRKRGTTCTIHENSPEMNKNFALELYGQQSKCVEHGRHWIAKKDLLTRTMLDWGSGCYRYQCTQDGLVIHAGNNKFLCQHKYQRVEVQGFMNDWTVNGSLICPSCVEFCGDKEKHYCATQQSGRNVELNTVAGNGVVANIVEVEQEPEVTLDIVSGNSLSNRLGMQSTLLLEICLLLTIAMFFF